MKAHYFNDVRQGAKPRIKAMVAQMAAHYETDNKDLEEAKAIVIKKKIPFDSVFCADGVYRFHRHGQLNAEVKLSKKTAYFRKALNIKE